jgi:hypothetical protein
VRFAFDGFVQPQRVPPECFIAEGVKAESAAALLDHTRAIALDRSILATAVVR